MAGNILKQKSRTFRVESPGFMRQQEPEKSEKLLGEFRKFLVEFINTTCSIYELHLASEERVAVGRYFHFHEGILFAVFPGDGFFRIDAGLAYESIIGRDVLENNRTVAGRMDIFFHVARWQLFLLNRFSLFRGAKVMTDF
jgi:hypothetical protein